MAELFLQDYGTVCKLFIIGDNDEDIKHQYYSLYNWNGTAGELYESESLIGGKQAYFIWSNKKKLLNYFYNILEHHYYMKIGHEADGPLFKQLLLKQAIDKFEELKRFRSISSTKMKIYGDFNYFCEAPYDFFE